MRRILRIVPYHLRLFYWLWYSCCWLSILKYSMQFWFNCGVRAVVRFCCCWCICMWLAEEDYKFENANQHTYYIYWRLVIYDFSFHFSLHAGREMAINFWSCWFWFLSFTPSQIRIDWTSIRINNINRTMFWEKKINRITTLKSFQFNVVSIARTTSLNLHCIQIWFDLFAVEVKFTNYFDNCSNAVCRIRTNLNINSRYFVRNRDRETASL